MTSKTKSRVTMWMDDAKYASLKSYCEEAGVSVTAAIDEAVEDFLLTSAAARLETIRATRDAKKNLLSFPAIQVPGASEPN
jgi:hypothetical protein